MAVFHECLPRNGLATQHAHNATITTTPSTQAEGLVSKKGFIQKKAHGGKGRFQKRFFAVQCQLLCVDAERHRHLESLTLPLLDAPHPVAADQQCLPQLL